MLLLCVRYCIKLNSRLRILQVIIEAANKDYNPIGDFKIMWKLLIVDNDFISPKWVTCDFIYILVFELIQDFKCLKASTGG